MEICVVNSWVQVPSSEVRSNFFLPIGQLSLLTMRNKTPSYLSHHVTQHVFTYFFNEEYAFRVET